MEYPTLGIKEVLFGQLGLTLYKTIGGPASLETLSISVMTAYIPLLWSCASFLYRGFIASFEDSRFEGVAGTLLLLPVVFIHLFVPENIAEFPIIPLVSLVTFLYTYVSARLVFARVCQFPSSLVYLILIPLYLVEKHNIYNALNFDEKTFTYSYAVTAFLFLLHFLVEVVVLYRDCLGYLVAIPKEHEDDEDGEFVPDSSGEDEDLSDVDEDDKEDQ